MKIILWTMVMSEPDMDPVVWAGFSKKEIVTKFAESQLKGWPTSHVGELILDVLKTGTSPKYPNCSFLFYRHKLDLTARTFEVR